VNLERSLIMNLHVFNGSLIIVTGSAREILIHHVNHNVRDHWLHHTATR